MVLSFCLSFISRYCAWLCIMIFGVFSIVFVILLVGPFPVPSSATLRSWFCGSCATCQACPPCAPQVNVVPHCECHENLNNCNCRCLTQQNLHEYYLQWSSHLGVAYNNTAITQMNSYLVKRRLLLWLLGLLLLNLFLLIIIGFLILFSPFLIRRFNRWHSHSRLQRRARVMKKMNLVEPPLSSVELSSSNHLPSHSLDQHMQVMMSLTQALQATQHPVSSPVSTTTSRIT